VKSKQVKDVHDLTDVRAYLDSVTLDALLTQLKAKGITQKAFAEQIGMSTRHLAAIKSSELRNHYFNARNNRKIVTPSKVTPGVALPSEAVPSQGYRTKSKHTWK
jgi:predicted DNA-binding ArsR family transcriptional regulator